MRKTIGKILDYFGIHSWVNKIRFFVPTLIKRKMLHKHGLKALIILKDVFEKNESFFWLEFGTLLGAHRDKAFIGHDYDVDLGVLAENRIKDLSKIIEPLGFIKTREIYIPEMGIIEETYVYNGTHIDFLYFYNEGDSLVCYLFTAEEGEYWREVMNTKGLLAVSFTFKNTGFGRHLFYDNLFFFPKDTDLHLRECYGNFDEKIEKWSDDKCPNRKITEIRCFFRKLR